MFPVAKTSTKTWTLIRPMTMGIGRQVTWDSPSFPVKLLDGQHQPQRAANMFSITFGDVGQKLSQMPESYPCCPKSFTWPILMPLQRVLQHFWELSGQLWKSESVFQDVSWALLTRTVEPGLVSHTQHSGASSWKNVILDRLGTILSQGLFHLPADVCPAHILLAVFI